MLKKMLSVVLALMMVVSIIAVPVVTSAADNPKPFVQFLFNEDAKDSVSGAVATVNRTVQYSTDSKFGRVLNLGGTGYLTVPGTVFEKPMESFTMATWVNVPSWQWYVSLIGFGKNSSNEFFFMPGTQYNNAGWGVGGAIVSGTKAAYAEAPDSDSPWAGQGWFHVAVTVDAENDLLTYYLNGEKKSQVACTLTAKDILDFENPASNVFYIGRSIGQSSRLDARVHDMRLYDSALTSDQLKAAMAEASTDEATLRNRVAGIELGTLTDRTTNFTLPKSSNGVTFKWESSNNDLVNAETGVVTRPLYTNENDYETAVLTVTATYKDLTLVKEYTVTVPKIPSPETSVNAAYDALNITGLDLAGYVTKDLELPLIGELGSLISWHTSNPDVITADGKVTRPEEDTEVILTARILKEEPTTQESFYREKAFTLKVLRSSIEGVVISIGTIAPLKTKTGEPATGFPEEIQVKLSSGNNVKVPVVWDIPEDYYNEAGAKTIVGSVENAYGDNSIPKIVVNVYDYAITNISDVRLNFEYIDDIPELPKQVTVVMSNGKFPAERRDVVWDSYDPALFETQNEVVVSGTVEGTDLKATATLCLGLIARPVYFNQVKIQDEFWSEILKKDILVTIPACVRQIEASGGGWDNFLNIAKKRDGLSYSTSLSGGMVFTDSDIHKTVEAMAIALEIDPQGDEEIIAGQEWIKNKLEEWVPIIVKAQVTEGDDAGYLNAWYELACDSGRYRRWSNYSDHELYVAGHFIESAVSHYRAFGGKDTRLYDVAIKLADYLCDKFEHLNEVPGHEEIEVALVKLANLRNEINGDASGDRYTAMAKIFINRRGRDWNSRPSGYYGGTYSQDATTIQASKTAVGHSVRFGYYVMAVTDIAMNEGDEEYMNSLQLMWRDCVDTKMYITGATGTSGGGSDAEGFGPSYYLPDSSAYAETCATVSNMKWAQRMNQLFGDSEYADVMEKVLYNGFMHGISVSGDRFFYTNPLQGRATRSTWFSCACCPPNIARTIASVSEYAYVVKGRELRANTFFGSTATIDVEGKQFIINTDTKYPYEGYIKFSFTTEEADQDMRFKIRVPSWNTGYTIALNGEEIAEPEMEQGYIVIDRLWNTGDYIEFDLAMDVKRVYENEKVTTALGKVALTRGPIVYSFETNDNPGLSVTDIALPTNAELTAEAVVDGNLGSLVKVTAPGTANVNSDEIVELTAIPFYLTHNRNGSIATHINEIGDLAALDPCTIVSVDGVDYTGEAAPAIVNEDITVVVKTDGAVNKLYLYNENGKGISKNVVSIEYDDNGFATWTLSLKVGTKGNRSFVLKYRTTDDEIVDCDQDLNLKVGTFKADQAIEKALISAEADKAAASVNEKFNVVVKASASVDKIGIFNEKGAGIGKALVSRTVEGGTATFVYSISVGSKGNRSFTVKIADDNGNWIDEGAQSFSIAISK